MCCIIYIVSIKYGSSSAIIDIIVLGGVAVSNRDTTIPT